MQTLGHDTKASTDKILERSDPILAAVIAQKQESSPANNSSTSLSLFNAKEDDFHKLAIELGHDEAEAIRRYFAGINRPRTSRN